jgi:4,5-dihydroxyphthalate decarboxylase
VNDIRITLAASRYDRTLPLIDGRVQVNGVDLTYLPLPPAETFFRMLRFEEFDVAEMSLSSYMVSLGFERKPFVAIPAFLSRQFRHSGIYVTRQSGLTQPADLRGARIGVPEFQQTAGVWVRGILQDHEGVPLDGPTYYQGGQEEPGRPEKLPITPVPGIKLERIASDQTLVGMLLAGELDAIVTPRAPKLFFQPDSPIVRLYQDHVASERAYFEKTGIFPIMHVVAIRRELTERYPWLARELYKGFERAKQLAASDLAYPGAPMVMLPWLSTQLEDAKRVLGADYWPYGIDANSATLETFLRYMREQGLCRQDLTVRDLFEPSTGEGFLV